jgi:SAM-dependent methyltransferase
MLDLGCGSGLHRSVIERAGFKWIGLDFRTPEATFLGDAQALPFKDNQFEFLLVLNVFMEVQCPWIAIQETFRVLKPGGKLIGVTPFLEPSYGESYFHQTNLGVYHSLKAAGFKIISVSSSKKWNGLKAMAHMALFPKMPKLLASAIIFPVYALHRVWWFLGTVLTKNEKANENYRQISISGDFTFVATK